MKRRETLGLIGAAGAAAALGFPMRANAAEKTMVTVVKITGIPWFNLVDKGLKRGAKQFGIDVQMVGPAHVDPAQQVKLVEDLIAKKVDVIGLVPLDVKVLAPVLAARPGRRHQGDHPGRPEPGRPHLGCRADQLGEVRRDADAGARPGRWARKASTSSMSAR